MAKSARIRSLLFGLPASTVALMIMFLAAIDSWATVAMLSADRGRELNPIMLWLFGLGPDRFLLVKLLLTALCVRWIMQREQHPYARIAALVAFAIYLPIVGLHIANPFAMAVWG